MSLDYEQHNQSFEAIAGILDEYMEWFGLIALATAYYEEEQEIEFVADPEMLMIWLEKAQEDSVLSLDVIENLKQIHNNMISLSRVLKQSISSGKKPDYTDFTDFKNLFDSLTDRLKRLERDSFSEESGMDELTGLRNDTRMIDDLKKEMERIARRDNPFSIVYVRMDQFAETETNDSDLVIVSNNIKKCMRTFDDAYYLQNGYFLLSLKQSDMIGAQAAISRLQQYLIEDNQNTKNITLSYCVGEPTPGDDVEKLIENMHADLETYHDEKDVVLKFVEVSPLQRYMEEMETI
ncbi:MAG: diguanylate cyclase [Pseudomonadota bacterium]